MLVKPLGVLGIAISSSLSGYVGLLFLYRKSHISVCTNKQFFSVAVKIILASSLMFFSCALIKNYLGFPDTKAQECMFITLIFFAGTLIYSSLLLLLKDEATIAVAKKILCVKKL